MKNKNVKKSLEKSKNALEERRKNGQAKDSHKKTRLQFLLTSFKSNKNALTSK